MYFFFFSSRRRHTRWTGDWSSDVCSSDLARVEVVAILRTADAGLAMAVPDDDEGRLAVDALHGQQRAERAAPPALALEGHAARERRRHRGEQEDPECGAVRVEEHLARWDESEEEGERDQEAVGADDRRQAARALEAEAPRRLIRGRERADVPPEPRREEEEQREKRDDQAPEDEESDPRGDEEGDAEGERREHAGDA